MEEVCPNGGSVSLELDFKVSEAQGRHVDSLYLLPANSM